MDEEVLVIGRKDLPADWLGKEVILPMSLNRFDELGKVHQWHQRQQAENDETVKQIIPYLIILHRGKTEIAIYPRQGSEKRLHGLYSIGIGGHINSVDMPEKSSLLAQIIIQAAKRELREEVPGYRCDGCLNFMGIINEELTRVGRTHLGAVFIVRTNYYPVIGPELQGLKWVPHDDVLGKYSLELWSEMAFKLIKPQILPELLIE